MAVRRYAELCIVAGCAKPHFSKGFCDSHHQRWKRYGDPLISKRPDDWFDPKKKTKEWAAFRDQRNAARQRGIEWQLTFDEWLEIWLTSGKLDRRGRVSGGFVMSRFGDVGPYAVSNVEIVSHEQNSAQPHYGNQHNKGRARSTEARQKTSNSLLQFYADPTNRQTHSLAVRRGWQKRRGAMSVTGF